MSKRQHRSKKESYDESENSKENAAIDFSKVKTKIKQIGKGILWMRKHVFTNTVNIWLLVAVLMFISIYVRMGPATLPMTDQWAQSTVISNMQNNIEYQVRQQRPDLPDASVQQLVQSELNNYYAANKVQIDAQIKMLSAQFKAELQDDSGRTHILGIDEYLWYSYAKWYVRTGSFGTETVNGKPRFLLRYGRIGLDYNFMFPSYSIVLLHDFLKIFNHDQTIEQTSFYISIILMALVCIPAFFLGRKMYGNTGGFFAAAIVAVSATLVGRTLVGAPESDGYTVLFPLLMTWLFFEALDSKKMLKTILLSAAVGLSGALFFFYWGGWWFTLLLIIGMAAVYIVYYALQRKFRKEKIFGKEMVREILVPVVIFVTMIIFVALITLAIKDRSVGFAVGQVISAPLAPLDFITGFKAAAAGNIIGDNYALWPNVLRTVAELNPASLKSVLASPGSIALGKIAISIFWLGTLGIILLFFRYKENPKYPFYGAFLLAWLISTVYAGTTGVRFMVFVGLATAFGIGSLVSFVTGPGVNSIVKRMDDNKKSILKWTFIILLFFALLWVPIKQAKAIGDNAVPIFDDAWYKSMEPIANDTNKAITTSWWDYGHFFEAISEQTVTFDGGDQGKRIYWVGKTLITPEEDEALDILKVLNCGEEDGYNLLETNLGDRMEATMVMLNITRQTREQAKVTLQNTNLTSEQIDAVLKLTHCSDLYDMYFITSDDMVGKATVWGYFGSWDFEKAFFYYHLRNLPLPEAIEHGKEYLGLNANETRELYNKAKKIGSEDEAASWISFYPGYITQKPVQCAQDVNKSVVLCNYNIILDQQTGVNVVLTKGLINLTDVSKSMFVLQAVNTATNSVVQQNAIVPAAIVLDKNGNLTRVTLANASFGYDVVLYKNQGQYYSLITHPALSQALFTKLFFMDGQYTTHFSKVSDITSFRGERIIVWKVNP